jgi:hypothetical protein
MSDQINLRFDAILNAFEAWVRQLGPIKLSFAAPVRTAAEKHVNLFLIDISSAPVASAGFGERTSPFQVLLRYLVSVVTDDPIESQRLLCALIFSAQERSEFEVEFSPVSIDLWKAFDVPPRPAFFLRVPLRLDREAEAVPRVRQLPELRHPKLRPLRGVVLGPGDLPVVSARVELPAARLVTRTDTKGRFFFSGVPSESRTTAFRVQAKAQELVTELELPKRDQDTLIIQFNPLEV